MRPLAALAVLALAAAVPAAAQDTTFVADTISPPPISADPIGGADSAALREAPPHAADTLTGRLSPMGAFWRSALLPGWGQASLGRRTAAGLFIAFEGVSLAMTVKTASELSYLQRTGSERVDAKKQQREDWLVLLAFNHLLSGLEAYVSAQLGDFPADLRVARVPGGAAAEVSVPIRIR